MIQIKEIKKLVCQHFNITLKELASRSRKQRIVMARQIGIYLARKYADGFTLQAIGKEFNKHHATVMHSINVIEYSVLQGGSLGHKIEYLSELIESGT